MTSVCITIKDPEWKDDCYRDIGILNSDTRLCDEVVSGKPFNQCILGVALKLGDWDICNSMIGLPEREDCFFNVGVKFNSTDACGMITDSATIASICFSKVATATNNIDVCNFIRIDEMKQGCIAGLS